MTLANKITVARIIAVPVFSVLLLHRFYWAATIAGLLIGLTDALDGLIARHLKQKTELGTFLDPLADKALLLATYGSLVHLGDLPSWVLILIITRDGLIFLGWVLTFVLLHQSAIKTRMLGKWSTAGQMIFAFLFLLNLSSKTIHPYLGPAIPSLLGCMVVITILSMLDYLFVGSRNLEKGGKE